MLGMKLKRAKLVLEKYKDYEKKVVFFSGGKDSLVALDLAYQVWGDDFKVVFVEVVGNTHPLCIDYVENTVNSYGLELIHLKTDVDFFDMLAKTGYFWCGLRLKSRPFRTVEKDVSVKGHRTAAENIQTHSTAVGRSIWAIRGVPDAFMGVEMRDYRVDVNGKALLNPVWEFSASDIDKYFEDRGLSLNPCYSMFMRAGDCVFCPTMLRREFLMIKENAPEFFERWKQAHEKLRSSGRVGKESYFKRFDEWYEKYC